MTFRRPLLAGLGLLAALTAVLFMVAPVEEDITTYTWSPAGGAENTALPLFPYQAQRLDVSFGCADASALDAGGLVLSTTAPPRFAGESGNAAGLAVETSGGAVTVRLGEDRLATRPAGENCRWTVHSGEQGTSVWLDDTRIGHTEARPVVNGLFTDLRGNSGLRATVVPDTRYDSHPSALKIALGALTVACVAALLVLLRRWESPRARRIRLLPRGWWRPRAPDVVVVATLLVWTVIGAATVDDGYIITMLKSAGDTDFVGNYFRWFNAPEAPFSWFYELYRPLVEIGANAWWMRLPSLVLALVSWLLIDRVLLRRFVTGKARLARWTAAAVFLVWSLTFGIGLRPEPWVVLGTLLVFALVERALATRGLTPLVAATVVAGATMAITPTGVIATAPFVAALPGLVRVLRRYGAMSLAVLLGAAASTLLLMFHDQSLSTVLHATDVRTQIGPSFGWQDESLRYEDLFDPTQTGMNRRMPLTLLWFSMVVLTVLLLTRRTAGLATRPTRRLLVVSALFFGALAFTPTKYTHHFGAVAGLGTLLVAALVHTVTCGALRRSWERSLVLVLATVATAFAVYAPVRWWFLSGLSVKWATVEPGFRNIPLALMVLVGGLTLAVAGLFGAWRLLRTPGWIVTLVAVCTVVVEVTTMAYAMAQRWDTYSTGRANLAALSGDSCGVEDWLQVEPDVTAGLLPRAPDSPPATLDGFTANGGFPADRAPVAPYGTDTAPVWGSGGTTGSVTTGWYTLPDGAGSPQAPPLVVPVNGEGAVSAKVQLADAAGVVREELSVSPDPEDGAWDEVRLEPGHASRVRIVAVDDRDGHGWIAVGAPRLPKVVPLTRHIPVSERVLVDWVDAFVLPCRKPASVADGITQPVRYRLAAGPDIDRLSGMSFDPDAGGPYAPLVQLATQRPVPTYLRGDKLFEPISVFRLDYSVPMHDVRSTHQARERDIERNIERSRWIRPGKTRSVTLR